LNNALNHYGINSKLAYAVDPPVASTALVAVGLLFLNI